MMKISEMAEGVKGFEVDKAQDLFFSMLSFSPQNSYYLSSQDKFDHLMNTYKELPNLVALSLAYYSCKVLGRRLAPNLVMTDILYRSEEGYLRQLAKYVMAECFTRPDFLSISAQYIMDVAHKKSIKHIPSYVKKAYKRCLQNMDDVTLKKQKMENGEISVADLIKVLRPNPTKSKLKEVTYKDFIEGNKNTKLTVNAENKDGKVVSLNATLSDNTKTTKDKREIINKNLKSFGATDIIRNLSNIDCTDENKKIIEDRLRRTINSKDGLRKLNPFDLIISNTENIHQDFIDILDSIIVEWVNTQCQLNDDYVVIVDMSGSMGGNNGTNASKFLSLVANCLKKYTVRAYDEHVLYSTSKKIEEIIEKFKNSPNKLFYELNKFIYNKANNCTYTRRCVSNIAEELPEHKILLLTDEFSYDDVSEAQELKEAINKQIIIYNCEWSGKSAFNIEKDLLRISGFQAQILNAINSLDNFDEFVQNIVIDLLKNFSAKK